MWQRWNQTTHIFEKSTDDGANWTPLPLDGSIISEGLLSRSRIPSQVAYKDEANIFTEDQEINKVSPVLTVRESATDVAGRLMTIPGQTSLNYNLWWDGSAWHSDDPTIGGMRYRQEPTSGHVWYFADASATPNPLVKGQLKPDGTLDIEGGLVSAGSITEHNRSVAMGEWQPYTPAWTASTTNPTLGNGTLFGRYTLVGKTCYVLIRLTFGSTSNAGVGAWRFSLPFSVSTNWGDLSMIARWTDTGTAHHIGVATSITPSTVAVLNEGNTGSGIGAGIPIVWATNDSITINGFFEIN